VNVGLLSMSAACCQSTIAVMQNTWTPAGQGFGQASEDAHELAWQLATHGLNPEALRAFEAARVNRMKRVADTEWVS
jgi:2-polyprenyl-6-methoxyphenol hydroxylase-like FAD-dependent oxidoreductase